MIEILQPVKHGVSNKYYDFKGGEKLEDDNFFGNATERLLKLKLIKSIQPTIVNEPTPITQQTSKFADLPDLSKLSIADAIEIAKAETSLTNLEFFKDSENNASKPRLIVLREIDNRVKHLTGKKK